MEGGSGRNTKAGSVKGFSPLAGLVLLLSVLPVAGEGSGTMSLTSAGAEKYARSQQIRDAVAFLAQDSPGQEGTEMIVLLFDHKVKLSRYKVLARESFGRVRLVYTTKDLKNLKAVEVSGSVQKPPNVFLYGEQVQVSKHQAEPGGSLRLSLTGLHEARGSGSTITRSASLSINSKIYPMNDTK
jgi:hypothetical protein